MRSHRTPMAAAVAAAVAVAACAPMNGVAPGPGVGAAPAPGAPAATTGAEFGGMFADTEALYTGTLEGARFAAGHTQDAAVRDYANRLVQDYTAAQQRIGPLMQREGITARPGEGTQAIQRNFQETGERLRGLEGRGFDEGWIDHQIAMNRWMLENIDRHYMPQVGQRPELQRELTTLRTTLQAHLDEAERIRGGWQQQQQDPPR